MLQALSLQVWVVVEAEVGLTLEEVEDFSSFVAPSDYNLQIDAPTVGETGLIGSSSKISKGFKLLS
jgi:hypothetical protein